MKVVSLAFAVISSVTYAEIPSKVAQSKTSKWLWDNLHSNSINLEGEAKSQAMVYMKERADLSGSKLLTSKAEKGQFVHKALVDAAENSQKSLVSWLKANNIEFKPYWITNLIVVNDATSSQLEEIAVRDDVLRVVGNPNLKPPIPAADKSKSEFVIAGVGQNLQRVKADRVWEELKVKGEKIVIAGQDTGVQWDHPALKAQYRGFENGQANHNYNWHDAISKQIQGGSKCGYNLNVPCDDNNHGTHTIGTVVGADNAGNQIGMAPGAKWISCRNMDNGIGRPSTYIECFQFFLAPWKLGGDSFKDGDPTKAPHVINNSWGCTTDEGCEGGEFEPVLQSLEAAGVMVVVSAGNEGPSCSTIKDGPAFNSAHVLSVGAMDSKSNKIASFSSRGPSTFDNMIGPHITAPGVNIRSSVPGGSYASFGWSGTSMAGPHVVGQVALLWSARPELIGDIAKTRQIIKASAEPTKEPNQTCGGVSGNSIPNNTWGFGTIDALKAIKTM